ncbi:MAG TPA: SDR family NAD(P)-dependent oxidoreductase [Candidatus Eisenbacteria bacterium]|nr:SDR family NAD(P)-dependent oxidoreductase [Candidatus Eisenbacteria bacterium]
MRRLEGRVAIITGAAAGIGRASMERFADEGAIVVGADVDDGGAALAGEIERTGGRAVFVRTDVTRDADLEALVRTAVERFGRLDVLFNNAGVGTYVPFDRLAPADWDRTQAVNLRAVYRACQIALPHLRSGGGVILNTASQSALEGQAMNEAYCASKAGVVALTRSLAREYGPHGVRVNCLCPGGVDTALLRGFLGVAGIDAAQVAKQVPLRRIARPAEIAAVAAFLASDDASYVTGVALPVDGGATA